MLRRLAFVLASAALVANGCSRPAPTPLEQARELFWRKEYDQAIQLCTATLESEPQNTELLILRGQIYQTKKHFREAVADFTSAIQVASEDPEAYYHRANAYRELGDEQAYLADARRARELDVKYQLAYQNQTTTSVVVGTSITPTAESVETENAVDNGPGLPENTGTAFADSDAGDRELQEKSTSRVNGGRTKLSRPPPQRSEESRNGKSTSGGGG